MVNRSKKYVCRYFHNGSWWTIQIDALDYSAAEARAERLGCLEILGELGGTIDARSPGASFFTRAICAVRNLFLANVKSERRERLARGVRKHEP